MAGERYVGAVWTGEAWLAVAFDREGIDRVAVYEEIGGLWLDVEEVGERVLVSVPVGLVEERGERPPEPLAREVLGPRADTVYTPPVREATRKRRFSAATRAHERKAGDGLSRAAFDASDAIAQVDELLQEVPEARPVIAEAHPEVCFRAFAGEPIEHPREVAAGYAARMRTLVSVDRDAPPAVQSAAEGTDGHPVTIADVLDGMALAYTARPGPGTLRTLPTDPPTDPTGLEMAMTYRADRPLV
jgi:predicted RNase H-like nuclease